MQSAFSHAAIDRRNAVDDGRIAAELRRDGRLLRLARKNLNRWMARDRRKASAAFKEWDTILTVLSRTEIAAFLRSGTPMCRRLRQSSPFMGLLKDKMRPPKRHHDKARA